MALDIDPAYPVRVTAGGQNHHPSAVETSRGLLALVYQRDGQVWRTYSLDRGQSWSTSQQLVSGPPAGKDDAAPTVRYNHRGGFALVFSRGDSSDRDIFFEEINEVVTISENLVSARISRSSDAASKGADVVVANPNRIYDPETAGTRWSGVFMPGTRFVLQAGYGGQVATRFVGYMDAVEIDDDTATIHITGRGVFRQLLDQSVGRDLYYSNARATRVAAQLAVEAGIDAEMMQIQDSAVTYSAEVDRERTYMDVISEIADLLGYELIETDEGGMICRAPSTASSASWFYEEDVNMFSRTRSFSDEDVYTRVRVYRREKKKPNGDVAVAAFTVERVVDTEFLTPANKIYWKEVDASVTEAQAGVMADEIARQLAREGNTIQIVSPLNAALEVGDVVSIRRRSIEQSGLYLVEELDDDLALPDDGADTPAFASTITARRVG
ncbi:MAG: phage tail protein [Rubrobacteraceae bacterium]|nr:phage tail protein [Rubrobacteraceae bacterium]